MNWLSLGPIQTLLLWLAASALAVWLYLHQRPIRRRVSTLRFWADLPPSIFRRRRWLREPWALAAQILFLLFVILALANVRWGNVSDVRRVAIVMDASIWSQVQLQGQSPLIAQVRADTDRILNSLPNTDEVLLLRAEADAAPALPFSPDRAAQLRAVALTRASSVNADVPRALEAAKSALAGSNRALLVYVGPGMLDEQQERRFEQFRREIEPGDGSGSHPQFLVRLVGDSTMFKNRGITRLALQRNAMQPSQWHLLTQLKNYGSERTSVTLKLSVGGESLLHHEISLAPGQLAGVKDDFSTDQGGLLQAELSPADDLQADDRAIVYVPPFKPIRVAVLTTRSAFENELRPVLSANPYLMVEFVHPGATLKPPPDIEIFDGGDPSAAASVNSIYFVKGKQGASSRAVRVANWNPEHPVTRWVRTHDVTVRNPAVLSVRLTDAVLASGDGQPATPLIVAREENKHRVLIIGFDPDNSNFPQQSAFPLLMAGSVEWLAHPVEDVSDSLAAGELDLPGPATRIVSPTGRDLPFARNGSNVHLLALDTGLYHLSGPNYAATYAVNAPVLLPSRRIITAPSENEGVAFEVMSSPGRYLWTWLAVLAMVALWAEWWLFYKSAASKPVLETSNANLPSAGSASEQSPRRDETVDAKITT
jgi:hypothetical protein